MRSRRRSALLALVLAALAALAPGGLAQRFAFVSTRVPDELAAAYGRPPQGEVFLYLDGSELRLTRTPHASEYDPTPSPGGRYVAFAALDHADEEAGREAWGWWLGVVEALTGREVARWELPGSVGLFRPAGGFQLGWLGQDALLAQGVGEDGGWEVYRFDLASLDVSRVGSGFGIAVAPGRVPALGELPQRQLDPGGDLVREAQGRGRGAGVPAQAVLAAGELAAVGLDRPCEVDEVHVLVAGGDVLELHAPRPDELARAGGVHGAVADELDRHAGLLEHLAHGGLVGQLSGLDVAAGRQPQAELAVAVEQHAAAPDDEGAHGPVAGQSRRVAASHRAIARGTYELASGVATRP